MRCAFDLDNSLVSANSMVTVLEVEAKGDLGAVLEKDIANWTVDDIVDGRGLSEWSAL